MKNLFLMVFLFACFSSIYSQNNPQNLTDRELLIELRVQMQEMNKQMDKRFEQVDKRFEQVDVRFAELRDDMNSKFAITNGFLIAITGIFAIVMGVVITLLFNDRKIIIKKATEKAVIKMETDSKFAVLMRALTELAQKDTELMKVLRTNNLI